MGSIVEIGARDRADRAHAYLHALSALARRITDVTDPSAVLMAMVSIAGEALGVDRALIYRVDESAGAVVGLTEWLNPDLPELTATLATYPIEPFAPIAQAMKLDPSPFESHAASPDMRLVATGAAAMLHGDMSIRSLFWHPFGFGSDGFMVLVFNQVRSERAWCTLDRGFVDAVAAQVTLALHEMQIIEAKKTAEAAHQASSARFRSLYDAAPSMFFTLDKNGTVLSANRFAADSLGAPIGELVGTDVADFVHPEDRARVAEELATCFAHPGELGRLEFRKLRRDGSVIWVKETVRAQTSVEGAEEMLVVCDDVTDAKLAMEALLRSQNLDSLGLLSAQIAHDFNNLLVGVLTNAEIALTQIGADSPARDRVAQIAKAGHVARELVRQVLAFSGKPTGQKIVVDVDPIVRDVVSLLKTSIPEEVSVELSLGGGSILADPTQMKQLVMNLVVNAVEAISGPGRVMIRTSREAPQSARGGRQVEEGQLVWTLEVEDTGQGIPAAALGKIFDPLFTTKQSGRGLGLAAVAGIVRAHSGEIVVDHAGGAGTKFCVSLPSVAEAVTPVPLAARRAPVMARLSVLVLDDDPLVRKIVGSALEVLGHEPIVAQASEEALAYARDPVRPLSCTLLDLTMPSASGIEIAHQLRAHRPGLPVIIMSGFGESKVASRLKGVGSTGFLAKPFTIDELERALCSVMGGSDRALGVAGSQPQ